MAHKTLKFKIAGVSPLITHNGQLADPLNEFSRAIKRISSKRPKTDADHEEIARLEWYGSLYLDGGKPCLPGHVLEAALANAAKASKRGKLAQAGVICPSNYPIHYKGEADIDTLWAGGKHKFVAIVRVGNARVVRTRPMFEDWSCEFDVIYDPDVVNDRDVREFVKIAGDKGLCEWRPKYGRYEVVSEGVRSSNGTAAGEPLADMAVLQR